MSPPSHPRGRPTARGTVLFPAAIATGVIAVTTAAIINAGPDRTAPQDTLTAPPTSFQEPPGVLPLSVTTSPTNPEVHDDNVAQTICTGTDKYRPRPGYTSRLKRIMLSTPIGQTATITVGPADIARPGDGHLGVTYPVPGYRGLVPGVTLTADQVELDHNLPLSDGGDGYDPANLWPEPGGTARYLLTGFDGGLANSRVKDKLEVDLWSHLCRGDLNPLFFADGSQPSLPLSLASARRIVTEDWYRSYRFSLPSG